jgi:hypothetical protein
MVKASRRARARGPTLGLVADYNAGARARLAFAVAVREAADYARGLIGDVGVDHMPGELIRNARRLRLLALSGLDRAVLVERLAGTSWEQIAEAMVLPVDEARRRYEETVDLWMQELPAGEVNAVIYGDHTTGLRHDHDPAGTALALDQWWNRHLEPWEDEDTPVQRALTAH